jgi:3-dehydroquinate synthase
LVRVSINTISRPYEALIEQAVLRSAGTYIRELMPNAGKVFTITVAPVRKHFGKILAQSFQAAKLENVFVEMPNGERYKTLSTVEDLGSRLVKLGADRGSTLVTLGGGVVGDVGGFLASIYMRGINFIQIPTTFLAHIDSSVGGKTGVNLALGKNLLGTFKQPSLVLIDPDVLLTLPDREYSSGLFEALKTGIIRNPRIFDFMEGNRDRILRRDPGTMEWLIAECVRVKASVVGEDEEEHGLRKILNFGHTIGHALEAETSYRHFLHGEAVAWGMIAATMISAGMQKTDSTTAQRIISAILSYAPLPKVDVKARNILRRLTRDKKVVSGRIQWVLPLEIGKVELVTDAPERAILQSIEELRYLSQA